MSGEDNDLHVLGLIHPLVLNLNLRSSRLEGLRYAGVIRSLFLIEPLYVIGVWTKEQTP